jgi:hypothetical protein
MSPEDDRDFDTVPTLAWGFVLQTVAYVMVIGLVLFLWLATGGRL